jgi:hypothetical protein
MSVMNAISLLTPVLGSEYINRSERNPDAA